MNIMNKKTKFGPGLISRFLYFLSGWFFFIIFLRAFRDKNFLEFWYLYLFLAFLTVIVGIIGYMISIVMQKKHQRLRNCRASKIMISLKKMPKPVYSLYLRAFSTTGMMQQSIASHQFEEWGGQTDMFLDFEAVLAKAVEIFAPLVKLGTSDKNVGAGVIRCNDSDWQEKLKLLAQESNFIFVLPSYSYGTMWEIQWVLKNGLIEKCFFVMPRDDYSINWAEEWEIISSEILKIGLRLPAYQPCGMIFIMNKEGKVELMACFDSKMKAKMIRKLIKRLLSGIGDNPDMLNEPIYHCPNCNSPYRLSEYRCDALEIFCSLCREKLPWQVAGRPMA